VSRHSHLRFLSRIRSESNAWECAFTALKWSRPGEPGRVDACVRPHLGERDSVPAVRVDMTPIIDDHLGDSRTLVERTGSAFLTVDRGALSCDAASTAAPVGLRKRQYAASWRVQRKTIEPALSCGQTVEPRNCVVTIPVIQSVPGSPYGTAPSGTAPLRHSTAPYGTASRCGREEPWKTQPFPTKPPAFDAIGPAVRGCRNRRRRERGARGVYAPRAVVCARSGH
jgi:hypothetical protein